MPAEGLPDLPVESYQETLARRIGQMKTWWNAGKDGLVPKGQAIRACCRILRKILRDAFLHYLRKLLSS